MMAVLIMLTNLLTRVTSYIQFWEQKLIQTKTVLIFPNNKPWIIKELKGILNEEKTCDFEWRLYIS